ncbi:MAG: DUF2723 domain-containing protein [Acidobacteria bacterium]|nr:DUF2723 domain-containing protein [Acidobacteriota bacterium]
MFRPDEGIAGRTRAIDLLLVLTAVLLTRFSWTPTFLWTDNVNLAYALETFDPRLHQPQPPGYPLFVVFARLVHFFVPSVEVTFWIISVVVTIGAACVLYWLANRMFSQWVAIAATILFLLNPVFWFTRLRSPLRPWLALLSTLMAYCAWRCWKGEQRFAFWGALALGIGTGFRPDVLAYLLPLWAASAWISTRSWKTIAEGVLIIAALSAVWLGAVVVAMGGIAATAGTIAAYLNEHSRLDSVFFAESARSWLRPVSRLIIWNGMAVVGWVWAPIIGYRHLSVKDAPWSFLLVWIAPGLAFQLVFHIAAPGHTLFATPVLCLAGAYLISGFRRYRDAILVVAAGVNAALFLNAVPRGYPPPPQASTVERAWISLKNSIAFGTFETSQERLLWWEEMREVALQELGQFVAPNRTNTIVALNGNDTEFDFINWREAGYYMNRQPIWVLMDNLQSGQSGRIRLVRGKDVQVTQRSSVPLPRSGRILWIAQQDGRFHRALERVIRVHRGRYILYSDIPAGQAPFEIEGFRFAPE